MQIRSGRILSIDIFRALTVFIMVIVNEWHGVQGLPDWMRHYAADADAMSFVDVVFPAFLFIVGMSIPFALQNRAAHLPNQAKDFWKTQSHIVQRALGLVVIGVFMVNAEEGFHAPSMIMPIAAWALLSYVFAFMLWGSVRGGPALYRFWRMLGILGFVFLALVYRGGDDGNSGMTHQWWGILGLIGWAYLIGTTCFQISKGSVVYMLVALGFCIIYFVLSRQPTIMSLPWGAVLLSQDPHFSHAVLVIAGCITSILFFDERYAPSITHRMIKAYGLAIGLALLATALRPEYKISKIYATPSWVLYCSSICIVLFSALYYWIELKRHLFFNGFFEPIAANPLIAYLIPFIFGAFLQLFHLALPSAFGSGVIGVLYGVLFSVIVALLTKQIAAFGIHLRI